MKKSYYLVPVTDHEVNFDGVSLIDILKIVDNSLYQRENERIGLIYSVPINRDMSTKEKEKLANFKKETSNLYNIHGVPEKIILCSSNGKLFELSTGKKVECSNMDILQIREVDQVIIDYYLKDNPHYASDIEHFIDYKRSNIIDFDKAKKLIRR